MIDFFDDAINEADEGFLIVMRVDPAASNPQDIPDVILERNGVSLVTILNDDRTWVLSGNINYTSGMCMKGSELNVNIGLQTNTNVGEIDCWMQRGQKKLKI